MKKWDTNIAFQNRSILASLLLDRSLVHLCVKNNQTYFKSNISAMVHWCLSKDYAEHILVVCLRRVTVEVVIKPEQGVTRRTNQANNFEWGLLVKFKLPHKRGKPYPVTKHGVRNRGGLKLSLHCKGELRWRCACSPLTCWIIFRRGKVTVWDEQL